MDDTTFFYIIIAFVVALLLAIFQYLYKNKRANKNTYILTFLRFISIFGLLLLLINPKFKKQIITTFKPKLVLLIDNSKSIANTKQQDKVKSIIDDFVKDDKINAKFELKKYAFSQNIKTEDSLLFNKSNTNIYKSLSSTKKLFGKSKTPVVLITDGNQTSGINYTNFSSKLNVFPVIVGDTIAYQDLKLTQLNVNKYAYLRHKFPVEAFVVYEGNKKISNTNFVVKEGNRTIYSQKITFDTQNAKQLNFYLPSNTVGIHNYKASISYLDKEKNKINNIRNFSVEIIDEQSKIVLISDISHPDIGMLKRAIESNKQRKLIVKKPTDTYNINDYQMVIFYQPNQNFATAFDKAKQFNKNFIVFTGTKTNWNFLNENQNYFKKKAIRSTEDYLANFNAGFTTFLTDDIGFNTFAPVQDYFGEVTFSVPFETLLFQQIGGFSSKSPLLATFEENNRRGAVFLGENSWRWRMSNYVEEKSFQSFDEFINKTIQYLASTKRNDLLEIKNESYYYANDNVKVTAYFYDANYTFNDNAKLWINITSKQTRKQIKYPFALQSNSYQVNIYDLKSGNYSFTVSDENQKFKKSGKFTILDYDIEQQFSGANKKELNQLAYNSNGKSFYLNQFNELKENLLQNKNYVAIQKSKEKITPLIDWKWLLAIIALSLSIEWFVRKYKGLL